MPVVMGLGRRVLIHLGVLIITILLLAKAVLYVRAYGNHVSAKSSQLALPEGQPDSLAETSYC